MDILITLIVLIISVVLITGGVILFVNLLFQRPVRTSAQTPQLTVGKPSPTPGSVIRVMLYAILFGLLLSIMLTQLWNDY